VGEVTGVVVQAPPLIVQAIVPVAPAATLVVQLVVSEPYVIGFAKHETLTVGVAGLIT
jgi:hypothetical protein